MKPQISFLQKLVEMLEDNNTDWVTITGEPGIGKTERALQACHYMGERRYFDTILFVHCRDVVAYSRLFPTSGGRDDHITRFYQLVSEALLVLSSA